MKAAVADFIRDPASESGLVRWLLDTGKGHTGVYSALLVGVSLDSCLNRQEPFRFFLCFWAASVFMHPSLIEK